MLCNFELWQSLNCGNSSSWMQQSYVLCYHLRIIEAPKSFSAKMTVYTRRLEVTEVQYLLSRGYWDIIYQNNTYIKIIIIAQRLAGDQNKKLGKFSSFSNLILLPKNEITGFQKSLKSKLIFSRRFRKCNWFLPSLLGKGRANMFSQWLVRYFFRFSQKSLNFLTEGWRVNLKSHLSHDWPHLYGTLRRKKLINSPQNKQKKSLEVSK